MSASGPSGEKGEWETFRHAPIVEAVLDLRVRLKDDVVAQALAGFQNGLEDRFPHCEEVVDVRSQFTVSPHDVSTHSSRTHRGYRFLSQDRSRAAHARLDGFTVNHLTPYTDWATLRADAQELWKRYARVARPVSVERLGLRYINRVLVPSLDLSEYFTTEPKLGPDLPQAVRSFNLQAVFDDAPSQAVVLLTQRTDEPAAADEGKRAIIVDIDVFRLGNFSIDADDIWLHFDALREVKNRVFFGCITEKAKELFR